MGGSEYYDDDPEDEQDEDEQGSGEDQSLYEDERRVKRKLRRMTIPIQGRAGSFDHPNEFGIMEPDKIF